MTRIQKILVANRGEIALRIISTCRKMGIRTTAVFSDADAGAPFVRAADEALRIGAPPASESYLVIDKILQAADRVGADAIHPGYGFLAENAEFAAACAKAGKIFIGPGPEAIRVLGSKQKSRQLVKGADVPVIPGYDGEDQSPKTLATEAERIGYPVLLKASAGGGGKGMRVVRQANELADAIEGARRESLSSFGDDTLLLERYIDRPRHIEIQILGDHHGNLVHLFERECSIQRRHQKIIEETPSPAVDAELREKMGQAALKVARAVGYTNAGTVELIMGPDRSFYFLEVNTRLQVEHPVTECITGVDLVREQIRVAQGEKLSFTQEELTSTGAAIECRLYAEDPNNEYLPTSGRIVDWNLPDLAGIRLDTGVTGPSDVSIHYDPMLAKIISHAPTRAEAIQKLAYALRRLAVQGIVTNREQLVRILEHPAFAAGEVDTHFLESHAEAVTVPPPSAQLLADAATAATLACHELGRAERAILPHLEPGYSNNRFADEWVDYRFGDETIALRYANLGGGRFRVRVGEEPPAPETTEDKKGEGEGEAAPEPTPPPVVRLVACDRESIEFEGADGLRQRWRYLRDEETETWHLHSIDGAVALREEPRFADASAAKVEGGCVAPMPGKIVKLLVSEGQAVAEGDTLVILEAMKMEHTVRAAHAGTVEQVPVAEGEQVDTDQLLVVVTPAETD